MSISIERGEKDTLKLNLVVEEVLGLCCSLHVV